MKHTRIFLLALVLLCGHSLYAEYDHSNIISFEDGVEPAVSTRGSNKLSVSDAHFKHGEQSLQWAWKANASAISIREDIAYEKKTPTELNGDVYTFLFWMFLEEPIKDSLRFEFFKEGKLCCWCCYGLDFTGWRSAWMAFDRDMQGTPQEGMDELRIAAPASAKKGTIFFDHIILSSLQDCRHHAPDMQAPYINEAMNDISPSLLMFWQRECDYLKPDAVTQRNNSDLQLIFSRLDDMYLKSQRPNLPDLRKRAEKSVSKTSGRPLMHEQLGEVYSSLGANKPYTQLLEDESLTKYCNLMLELANAYYNVDTDDERLEVAELFVRMARYLLDQGYQAGSGVGSLYKVNESLANLYPALFLMRDPLRKAGLLDKCQQTMEWFSGLGEVKQQPFFTGADMGTLATLLEPRLMAILMISDPIRQLQYLEAYSAWLDNGFACSNGISDGFKPDGTIFYHGGHYPAYAVASLEGAVSIVRILNGTSWAVNKDSRVNLKRALLNMRVYCNEQTWPVALGGSSVDGLGQLEPSQYKTLAKCGTPDGKSRVDRDLEDAVFFHPSGVWTFPYSCLFVQRRERWMVSVKGFNRYLSSAEITPNGNLYGRYMNYGNIQILGSGNPVSNAESGYKVEGFDWNHWPGTTATVLPLDELRARIAYLDESLEDSERLLSDEAFCNGVTLGDYGIWGMNLHEHDKYDGGFRAYKSVFFLGDRVICLGSNISSSLPAETHTTIYQVRTPDDAYRWSKHPKNLLSDYYGNYYVVRSQTAKLYKFDGVQQSRHPETDAPTSGSFHVAAINHGTMPQNASYEYVILVKPTKVTDATRNETLETYDVLRADSTAHVIFDYMTGLTGYVLFEANAAFENSRPCLVLTQVSEEDNTMTLSVADPDLHFYRADSGESYDEDGNREEMSLEAFSWKHFPSQKSVITLRIPGHWTMSAQSGLSAAIDGDSTVLSITCQHGLTKTFTLEKAN